VTLLVWFWPVLRRLMLRAAVKPAMR